ncbi:MAG: 6,7-dimethyl-8-ribityllumazine synthase [Cytophagales bacterium]|nr:6,7-dimethyl-8-ribityllumazine synthase [Bernardetiaceae bacterium]MDW8210066.1 6,7-dimethyl-8-ribityllumazine synthase [Cytophagales bacterium]
MASELKDLSIFSNKNLSDISTRKFVIVVSQWNSQVTERLYNGAYSTLLNAGAREENIIRKEVPGSFELSLGAQYAAQWEDVDAVICLGCLIKGETPHFDYIAQAVAHGITQVGLKYNKPVTFGVLTTLTLEQALERAGGKYGNKGDEAAIAAIKMLNF